MISPLTFAHPMGFMEEELKNIRKPTGYVEAPAKSPWFDTSLRLIGGSNPLGQPMLKVSWGWDCRVFRNENPEALAYPGPFLERWILEKWLPPEFFGTKQEWSRHRYIKSGDGKKIDCLGEFPRQGRYGMVMPLIAAGLHGTKAGDYLPCSNDVLQFIEMNVDQILNNTAKAYTSAEGYRNLQEQMANEEAKRWEEAELEADIFADEVNKRADHINRNPAFSFPSKSLWTPDGEITLH